MTHVEPDQEPLLEVVLALGAAGGQLEVDGLAVLQHRLAPGLARATLLGRLAVVAPPEP